MKNNNKDIQEEIKPDLRHDTMEYSASTDGDDPMDADDEHYEEEGISAEELDTLEDDTPTDEAYAMNAAETDKQTDEDNLPEEDWEDDLPDNEDEDESEQKQHHRK